MSRPPTDPSLPQDPHLQAALRHAPDADVQPPAALSASILAAARERAARQAPPLPADARPRRTAATPPPWWKRLLGGTDRPGGGFEPRWAGGMAVLFVTVVAGLIWIPQRPGVDILPPRPAAKSVPRGQDQAATPERSAGPAVAPDTQQARTQADKATVTAPRQEARAASTAVPAAAQAPRRPGTPGGVGERAAKSERAAERAAELDDDHFGDAAPAPAQEAPRPPAPVTAPAAPADVRDGAAEAARPAPKPLSSLPAAVPAPAPGPQQAPQFDGGQTARASGMAAPAPLRKQATQEAPNEDSVASARDAEKKPDAAGNQAEDRRPSTALSAERADRPATLPWQPLRQRLAQVAARLPLTSSNLKEQTPAMLSAGITWRRLPEGRPQPAGIQAMSWLDDLAAASGGWKHAAPPVAPIQVSAWAVEWQAPGLGNMRLLMADGQAWWRADDGSWWQSGLRAEAAQSLQRSARDLLEPASAAKPGNPQ